LQQDGHWIPPAGAIEPGESPATAVARETLEETGLVVRPERVAGVMGGASCRVRYPSGDEVEYTVAVFECAVVGGTLRADGDETLRLAFLPVRDVLARLAFTYPEVVLVGTPGPAYFERSV
jgi:8-oxo-dGTP pyrophosphatase MutT (NUDIX family)